MGKRHALWGAAGCCLGAPMRIATKGCEDGSEERADGSWCSQVRVAVPRAGNMVEAEERVNHQQGGWAQARVSLSAKQADYWVVGISSSSSSSSSFFFAHNSGWLEDWCGVVACGSLVWCLLVFRPVFCWRRGKTLLERVFARGVRKSRSRGEDCFWSGPAAFEEGGGGGAGKRLGMEKWTGQVTGSILSEKKRRKSEKTREERERERGGSEVCDAV
ncbi:hypothetical protein LX36DRAFT_475414 [Colletotrichum falcatum]|nr:hypothetical protein LX36DRAFT_475414 [Colletotrichum falcatum]